MRARARFNRRVLDVKQEGWAESVKIIFLCHYFPPEVNAPATRTHEHCREWVSLGHEVTVVTRAPNHPVGKVGRNADEVYDRRVLAARFESVVMALPEHPSGAPLHEPSRSQQ